MLLIKNNETDLISKVIKIILWNRYITWNMLISSASGPCSTDGENVTSESGSIKSPGYDEGSYPANADCKWYFHIQEGKVSTFRF